MYVKVCDVLLKFIFCALCLCYQINAAAIESPSNVVNSTSLHSGLTERIGNFSIELLYHTSKQKELSGQNMIISPFTVWTVLAVITEGASGDTLAQLNNALRIKTRNREQTRTSFREITKWLQVNTSTVELSKVNALFVDLESLPLEDFIDTGRNNYATDMIPLNFTQPEKAAELLNNVISNITHGRIAKIVESSYFSDAHMFLTSALYFKGQWTVPFNTTSTTKLPFYNSTSQKIGEVNMMYNRHTYPFANIKELQARVIELPYGKENRLSMLIMLPNPTVSLEDMFFNFRKVTLDSVFSELRYSAEEFGDDEVDCLIPRFKIESNLDLTNVLRESIGIDDLFDPNKARLPHVSRVPLHVSKIVHKAEIEVTEEGTTASGVTLAEFSNRIGNIRFEANRPFAYLIIEKITNSIVFGGLYQQPSLY